MAALLILALTSASCRTAAQPLPTPSPSPLSQFRRYCNAKLARETLPESNVDLDALSPAERQNAVREFAAQQIKPVTDKIVQVAPPPITAQIDLEAAAVNGVVETGELSGLDAPEVRKASEDTHRFDLENCGWSKVDVTAADYSFGGVPANVNAGIASFELHNQGRELHEMVIFRRNDGVTQSFDELLAMPEQEAQSKVSFQAEKDAPPGQDSYMVVQLTPGAYVMVCLVPVGSTPEAMRKAQETGIPIGSNAADVKAAQESGKKIEPPPPHLVRGMKAQFTVK